MVRPPRVRPSAWPSGSPPGRLDPSNPDREPLSCGPGGVLAGPADGGIDGDLPCDDVRQHPPWPAFSPRCGSKSCRSAGAGTPHVPCPKARIARVSPTMASRFERATRSRRRPAPDLAVACPSSGSAATAAPASPIGHQTDPRAIPRAFHALDQRLKLVPAGPGPRCSTGAGHRGRRRGSGRRCGARHPCWRSSPSCSADSGAVLAARPHQGACRLRCGW